MDVVRMCFKKDFPQFTFIVDDPDDVSRIFSDTDSIKSRFVQERMAVHVLPGGLKPVSVSIIELVIFNQKISDQLEIF